jgi:hypothetical protein
MLAVRVLVVLCLAAGAASGQAPGVLRVTVALPDAAQAQVPIGRHTLLISDNPPTREPRRVVTGADGTLVVNLTPGSYVVESDRPVAFQGNAYQWTTFVEIVEGRETTLALTIQNAELLPVSAAGSEPVGATRAPDPASEIRKWESSLVSVWSPTSLAAGFVVDARGLVATDRTGLGSAASVAVQLSPTLKVPGRIVVAEATHDVAIVLVDPSVLKGTIPIPVACPPPAAAALEDRDEIETIARSHRGTSDVVRGEITGFHPRGIETDLRLSFGESGGPVFRTDNGTVVGLTSIRADADARRGDVSVVRAGILCEAISAARLKLSDAAPLEPTPLPTEPERAYPAETAATATLVTTGASSPPVVSSADFDVTFITPPAVLRARERADRTGGRSVRAPEAEARLGRLTDFGSWAEYFADLPAVLIVRVTPKLVEGFWKRLAREAARTQGAVLPAFRDFKTNFLRLRAACGTAEVSPIHPFVLEHEVDEKRVVREGLYAFGPDAFGPHCASVTLTLSSEQAPEKADTITIDQRILAGIWQDFAPYRGTAQ